MHDFTCHAGIPSEQEYVDVYCTARGVPHPDPHDWCFFVSLGLFRLAAISAGVGARAKLGNASSSKAAQVCSQRRTTMDHEVNCL